jgi:hypothetical protein
MPELDPGSPVEALFSPDDLVSFHDAHRPALDDGDYRLTVTQTLVENGEPHAVGSGAAVLFSVAGPRFRLEPADIHGVYPPPGASGDFAWTLPHVVLNRATLPWERTALGGGRGSGSPAWLGLIVFEAGEMAQCAGSVIKVGALRRNDDAVVRPPLAPEMGDDPDAAVRVLDIPAALWQRVLPRPLAITKLTHVREVTPARAPQAAVAATAIVLSCRPIVAARQYEAHLVSLEGWMQSDGEVSAGTSWWGAADPRPRRMVSLHSWRFGADGNAGFKVESRALQAGPLRRDSQPSASAQPAMARGHHTRNYLAAAGALFVRGYVHLRHEFRDGDRAISLYRSPLSPCLSPEGNYPGRADDLVSHFEEVGMFDVSHAAAWELGRLLALQNPGIGQRLHQWRREWARYALRQPSQGTHGGLPGAPRPPEEPALGAAFASWLASEIWNLGAIPWRYLVPDDAMLPPESLRLFNVDRNWMACLTDGVLSIGRTSKREMEQERELELGRRAFGDTMPQRHGLLLRSRLLADYPGLVIEASADADGLVPCTMVRRALLAPDVMLILHEQPVKRVVLHLPPQVMHFEVPDRCRIVQGDGGLLDLDTILGDGHAGELAVMLMATMHQAVYAEKSA